jgi:hypothetical protein
MHLLQLTIKRAIPQVFELVILMLILVFIWSTFLVIMLGPYTNVSLHCNACTRFDFKVGFKDR